MGQLYVFLEMVLVADSNLWVTFCAVVNTVRYKVIAIVLQVKGVGQSQLPVLICKHVCEHSPGSLVWCAG